MSDQMADQSSTGCAPPVIRATPRESRRRVRETRSRLRGGAGPCRNGGPSAAHPPAAPGSANEAGMSRAPCSTRRISIRSARSTYKTRWGGARAASFADPPRRSRAPSGAISLPGDVCAGRVEFGEAGLGQRHPRLLAHHLAAASTSARATSRKRGAWARGVCGQRPAPLPVALRTRAAAGAGAPGAAGLAPAARSRMRERKPSK